MKVIITPQGGGTNPYIKLLVASLKAAGLSVKLARPGRFTLWQAVWEYGLPDVIHLQWHHDYFTANTRLQAGLRTAALFLQWLSLRCLGVRFAWTIHELVNFEKRQVRWQLMACRVLAQVVDKLIVHCPAAVPIVARAYRVAPERLGVAPLGHYADCYPPALDKQDARQMLGLPAQGRVFLFYGHIRRYKGLDDLLETFASLEAEDVRLILVGRARPPSLAHSLTARAEADARVMTHFEFVPDDQLIGYLSACDLVVLPYRETLTSSAVVLAASYGRPALMPKRGCMGEFPAEAAILYDPDSANGLRLALERALSAPLETMGKAAKAYIGQFPWSLVAAKTLAVYQSAVARHHTRPAMRSADLG